MAAIGGQVGCLGGERVATRGLRWFSTIGARCAVEGVRANTIRVCVVLGFQIMVLIKV